MALPVPLLLALTANPEPVERGLAPAVGATFFSTSMYLGLVASQKQHAPRQCKICRSNALDEGVRSAGVWQNRERADTLSNVGLAVTPVWALGSLVLAGAAEGRANGFDPLIVVESTMVAMLVNQLVKFEAARQRPYARHGLVLRGGTEDNLSFFSGHTTWGFASAVAAGSVASIRGYRGAPAVWAGGLVFAAVTGYLRIGADRHWLTDVLTGAVIGSIAGAVIPRLHFASATTTASAAQPLGVAPTWITVGGVF